MPLGSEIPDPGTLQAGRVGIRVVRRGDADIMRTLLVANRRWLEHWEATHPSGRGVVPGSVSMRPTIRVMRKQLAAGTGIPYVVLYDDVVVGQLSVSEISGGALQDAQIGYWVSEEVAGRGIVPLAVALAIDHLFFTLGLHRVEICIRPENGPSLRVVEKLGLRYEGRRDAYIHIDGAWRDHDCFAITREEIPGGLVHRLNSPASSA
ncbi:GNAT family N-acetyltransferase [Leucobacter sp. CSA2]|uniref:GNAT family N-acetyltransferase n=1 Tax=Leucobacter edaphi TaxID=2796472 RepID=A0A934QCA2_9MICO|nr:GNAT family protein [Leucobacter edaphi]MBK0420519.1 GNAT family N-acetyltransferase [Leucobacter edaphi]